MNAAKSVTEQDQKFDISLGSQGECEGDDYIKLAVTEQPHAAVNLSLKQARDLAIALIQQVHRAEVRSKLKGARQKQLQAARESIVTPIFGSPNSQQA